MRKIVLDLAFGVLLLELLQDSVRLRVLLHKLMQYMQRPLRAEVGHCNLQQIWLARDLGMS